MLPTIPTSAFKYVGVPDTNTIAVRGYRAGCGKTAFACGLAHQIATERNTQVQVITDDELLVGGPEFQAFLAGSVGADDKSFTLASTEQEGFAVTIYDVKEVKQADEHFYIAPPLMKDDLLGVDDHAGTTFRNDVAQVLAKSLGAATITFIDEGTQFQSDNARWLSATDWMVLRELERLHLADTPVGLIRNYVRNAALDSWIPGNNL
jgi:hypothetical protein